MSINTIEIREINDVVCIKICQRAVTQNLNNHENKVSWVMIQSLNIDQNHTKLKKSVNNTRISVNV